MAEKIIEHSSNDCQNIISPIIFDDNNYDRKTKEETFKEYYEGKYFYTNEGYLVKILEYNSAQDVIILFVYNNVKIKVRMHQIKEGYIRNPYHPNIYGAYIGIGKYNFNNSSGLLNKWWSMFQRTHELDELYKAYRGVIICKDWYNFQNYAEWYYNKKQLLNNNLIYEIDKDIRQIGINPKIYSPTTCCLIPKEINKIVNGIFDKSNKDLRYPIGVRKRENGTYQARISINRKLINIGHYSTPQDAFIAYKEKKLELIKDRAKYYYNINGLSEEDFDYIMNNFDLLPFNN